LGGDVFLFVDGIRTDLEQVSFLWISDIGER